MGDERELKPGAASLASANLDNFTPGKATLVQQHATGNRYIDGKSFCATEGAGTSACSLDPEVRKQLVAAYQREVRIAEAFYVQALGEIGLEQLIHKDEELPAILTLAIDLLGGFLGGTVAKALVKLRSSGPIEFLKTADAMAAFQATGEDGATPNALKTLLGMTSPQSVEALIKATTDLGKKKTKKVVETGLADDTKGDTLNYVDELKAAAAVSFQKLDLDFPGEANDGQLIAAFHAFKAEMGNDVPAFKAALKAKIVRYQATVAKIGRTSLPAKVPNGQQQKGEPQQDPRARTRDTQVAWVTIVGDPVPRLYYAKVDYEWHPDSAHPALDDKFVLTRPVELEFVNSAILRHQEKWKTLPPTRMMNREDLARETGDESLLMPQPHLDLSATKRARAQAVAPKAPVTAPAQPSAATPAQSIATPSVADAAVDVPPLLGGIP